MGKLAYRVAVLILFLYLTISNVGNLMAFLWGLASAMWAYGIFRLYTKSK